MTPLGVVAFLVRDVLVEVGQIHQWLYI